MPPSAHALLDMSVWDTVLADSDLSESDEHRDSDLPAHRSHSVPLNAVTVTTTAGSMEPSHRWWTLPLETALLHDRRKKGTPLRSIRIGTLCSGTEAPVLGLKVNHADGNRGSRLPMYFGQISQAGGLG